MRVLGISCYYHDAAACLIVDGVITAAAAEERFSRIKHDSSFPIHAINYCLDYARLAANELDAVVFYEKPILKFERVFSQHLDYFPKSYRQFIEYMGQWLTARLRFREIIKEQIHYYGDVKFIEHHLAHAASSYYLSNFNSATIVSLDGVGEWATTYVGAANGKEITIDKQINYPHSLGLLYSTFTTYLGFEANDAEYKVMGLAAYGKVDKRLLQKFSKLVAVHADGSFSLNMNYFSFGYGKLMYTKALVDLFEHEPRIKDAEVTSFHENLAATLQYQLEKIVFNLLTKTYDQQQNPNLCLSGGVSLNSVLNGKILDNTPFKKVFIPPDPGDAGGAMGAALYYSVQQDCKKINPQTGGCFTPYLGPDYAWYKVENVLRTYQQKQLIQFKYIESKDQIIDMVSDFLIDKKIIGWFQGRMEWGPRALGNRSILASATDKEMKDIINGRVKYRELFRPFAPVIIESHVGDYFLLSDKSKNDMTASNRWMLTVYPFKDKKKKDIPAVVHVDGSGRLESLRREDNPLYYDLLNGYYKKTGVPVLINTSFNVKGEPIVCKPEEAVECLLKTDIDYLIIDQFIVKKTKGNI